MWYVSRKLASIFSLLISSLLFSQVPAAVMNLGSSYNYGSMTQGGYVDHTFTFSNTGGMRAEFVSITSPTTPFNYKGGTYPGRGGNCNNNSLGKNKNCTIVVRFAPTTTGTFSTTFTLKYFDGYKMQTVSLSMSGTGTTPAALDFNNVTTLDFGGVNAGTSKQLSLTIRNTGGSTAKQLAFDNKNWGSNFSITGKWPGPGGTCTTSLASGSSCTVVVTASPTRNKVYTKTATLTYYDPIGLKNNTLTLRVDGNGNTAELSSISPTSGPLAGGNTVTLNGANFTGTVTVKFGTVAATNVVKVSTSKVTCTAPAGAASGTVNVTLTDSGGPITLIDGYYYAGAPTIAGITPSQGLSQSTNTVNITGTGFMSGATVTIGGSNCTGVTVESEFSITCTAPALSSRLANVVVTNTDAQSTTLTNGFEYIAYYKWVAGSNTVGDQSAPGPSARENGTSWKDSSGNLWIFGGVRDGVTPSGIAISERLNDLWKYSGGVWTKMAGSTLGNQKGTYGTQGVANAANTPGGRISAMSWTDSSNNLWLFGGSGHDAAGSLGNLNDLWKFDGVTWTWVAGSNTRNQITTSTQPGGRYSAATWIDASNKLWLYGGRGLGSSTLATNLDDLWYYNGNWINVSYSGGPVARNAAMSWVDASGNFWLFGGTNDDGSFNDLWKYNGTQWVWIKGSDTVGAFTVYGTKAVVASSNTPGARYGALNFTDSSGNLWMSGGYGLDDQGQEGYLNDLWMFNGTDWVWKDGAQGIDGIPFYGTQGVGSTTNLVGSKAFAFGIMTSSNVIYIFGGSGWDKDYNLGTQNDLWTYTP